jgi:hypothetical protein
MSKTLDEMTAQERKDRPLARGVLDYFPDALLEVANLSRIGNEQHNPGQPLHWAKEKSTDEADALLRHLIGRGTRDSDGERHSAKVAWRALALLQREIEAERSLVSLQDLAFRDTPWWATRETEYPPTTTYYVPEHLRVAKHWGPCSSVEPADASEAKVREIVTRMRREEWEGVCPAVGSAP